ncbi:hypothetical protein V6N13_035048 [Hibiscus sabdariffa]
MIARNSRGTTGDSILADADELEGLTTSRLFDGIVDVGISAPKGKNKREQRIVLLLAGDTKGMPLRTQGSLLYSGSAASRNLFCPQFFALSLIGIATFEPSGSKVNQGEKNVIWFSIPNFSPN